MARRRRGRARERQYLINALQKAAEKLEEMCKTKPKKAVDDLDKTALSIIENWYASYPNPKYKRQYGLKKAYKIFQDGLDISLEMDAEYMSDYSYHQSTEFIFYNSFMGGYHGGSFGTDKHGITMTEPTWRTPYFHYTYWGDTAPQSTSPYDQIFEYSTRRLKEYDDEWARDLQRYIMNPVQRSYNGYMRK